MGAFDVPDGRSAVKCRSTPRRRPIRRCHGTLLKSAGDDGEHDRKPSPCARDFPVATTRRENKDGRLDKRLDIERAF